ncbi:MAG: hypothetical protein R6U61_05505 [Thermoplasmata archaeon]
MEGISISGQTLYTDESHGTAQNKIHSILMSEGFDIKGQYQGSPISGSSTLNEIEVNFSPYQNGTMINIEHGMTMVGLLLTIILLFAGAIGIVILILWYIKYDKMKGEMGRAFPAYIPPPPHQQMQQQQNYGAPPPQ